MSGATTSNSENILRAFAEIKHLVFDVDGVLTDGKILLTEAGDYLRYMHTKDGYAMKRALDAAYSIKIITGGSSEAVKTRLQNLGVKDIHLGVGDKEALFDKWTAEKHVLRHEVLYMGDDIVDLEVMKKVGIAACPSDAVPEIKATSDYISPLPGGSACVRDVIEKVMRVQGTWSKT